LANLRKLYIGQLEIIWLTTKTFRLVAESRKASIRKRTREAPKILPFLRGHPGFYCGAVRCRADNAAEDFVGEGDFTLGHG